MLKNNTVTKQITMRDTEYKYKQIFILNYLTIGWLWRNFFIPTYAGWSGRHEVGQRNVNIFQHLQSDNWSGAISKLFLNLVIQFNLNNMTNLHQLTSHSRHNALQHGDHIMSLWPQIILMSLHPMY